MRKTKQTKPNHRFIEINFIFKTSRFLLPCEWLGIIISHKVENFCTTSSPWKTCEDMTVLETPMYNNKSSFEKIVKCINKSLHSY